MVCGGGFGGGALWCFVVFCGVLLCFAVFCCCVVFGGWGMVVVCSSSKVRTAKMCWGAAAPQTPLSSWRGSAPPDLPGEIRKWPASGYSFGGGAC